MIVGYVFDTPGLKALFVLALGTQQFAIAAAHQCEPALHQANCAIAQVVRFPGAVGDALFAEQRLADCTVSAAGRMRVERTDGGA